MWHRRRRKAKGEGMRGMELKHRAHLGVNRAMRKRPSTEPSYVSLNGELAKPYTRSASTTFLHLLLHLDAFELVTVCLQLYETPFINGILCGAWRFACLAIASMK